MSNLHNLEQRKRNITAFAAQPITHAYTGRRKYDPDIKISLYKFLS
jgi:hypothetical protein